MIEGIVVRKSPIHGNGVFATKEFLSGEKIGVFEGYEVSCDTQHSLTVNGHKIEGTGLLRYLNHSRNPNCYLKGIALIAKGKIMPREELLINYLETEETISHPFKGL